MPENWLHSRWNDRGKVTNNYWSQIICTIAYWLRCDTRRLMWFFNSVRELWTRSIFVLVLQVEIFVWNLQFSKFFFSLEELRIARRSFQSAVQQVRYGSAASYMRKDFRQHCSSHLTFRYCGACQPILDKKNYWASKKQIAWNLLKPWVFQFGV